MNHSKENTLSALDWPLFGPAFLPNGLLKEDTLSTVNWPPLVLFCSEWVHLPHSHLFPRSLVVR